jgi:hypothetical protein
MRFCVFFGVRFVTEGCVAVTRVVEYPVAARLRIEVNELGGLDLGFFARLHDSSTTETRMDQPSPLASPAGQAVLTTENPIPSILAGLR